MDDLWCWLSAEKRSDRLTEARMLQIRGVSGASIHVLRGFRRGRAGARTTMSNRAHCLSLWAGSGVRTNICSAITDKVEDA